MIYKIFPKDNRKLRRIALKKLIPNLLSYLSSINTNVAIKLAEQSKINKYLKELLVIKCAIDFKINFHLATSEVGQSSSTEKLISDLLPFAIEFHSALTELGYEKLYRFSTRTID